MNARHQAGKLSPRASYCNGNRALVTSHGIAGGGGRRRGAGRGKEKSVVGTITRLILLICVLAIAGGAALLATRDIPAPTARVEKVIPADRFK